MAASSSYSTAEWKRGAVVLAIGLVGIGVWQVATHETQTQREARLLQQDTRSAQTAVTAARGSALLNCQRAIKNASRDPSTAQVPAVEALVGGADYRFLWSAAEPVRLRNGLGLEVSAPALCVVDETSGKIKLLTLDGQPLIGPKI
nr:hypothetical protein [uncultured Albidiferax sp.]